MVTLTPSEAEKIDLLTRELAERTTDRDGWMKQAEGMADFLTELGHHLDREIARITKGERQVVQDLADALNANQALEAWIAELKAALRAIMDTGWLLERGNEDLYEQSRAALSTPTGAKVMALIESCKRMRDAPIGTESPFSPEFVDAYSLMVANLAALDGGQKDG